MTKLSNYIAKATFLGDKLQGMFPDCIGSGSEIWRHLKILHCINQWCQRKHFFPTCNLDRQLVKRFFGWHGHGSTILGTIRNTCRTHIQGKVAPPNIWSLKVNLIDGLSTKILVMQFMLCNLISFGQLQTFNHTTVSCHCKERVGVASDLDRSEAAPGQAQQDPS